MTLTDMTPDRAQALVLSGIVVSASMVIIRDAAKKQVPPMRFVVGTLFAGAGLAVLAQTMPPLAGGVAILMMLTATIVYGREAWDAITKASKSNVRPVPSQTAGTGS